MSTFSKLVICVVMLRGRHRGLPVALDRAIVFPTEFVQKASEKVRKMKMKTNGRGGVERAATRAGTAAASAELVGSGQGEKLTSVKEGVSS